MSNSNLLLLIIAVCLTGCATPHKRLDYYDQSTETLRNYTQMTFFTEAALTDSQYTDLGLVSGFSCMRDQGSGWTEDGSKTRTTVMNQLKLNAAALGVTHITTPQCVVSEKMDLTNNCWASLTCTSHALQLAGD